MSHAIHHRLAFASAILALLFLAVPVSAQDAKFTVMDDCSSFAFSPDGSRIVYSAQRFGKVKVLVPGKKKKKKRVPIEQDDIWEVNFKGKTRMLVDGTKLFKVKGSPPISYAIQAIRMAPDGQKMTVEMATRTLSLKAEAAGKTQSGELTDLMTGDGKEIDIAGTKNSIIKGALNAVWLADGQTVVYMKEAPHNLLYTLAYLRPTSGAGGALLRGHYYVAVAWNPAHNVAAAIEQNPDSNGPIRLVWIDLLHHTERTLATLDSFKGHLTVSPSANQIAYYSGGNTITVRSIADPSHVKQIEVPYGRYEWAPSGKYLLLKPGPDKQSNLLIQVNLPSGQYHDVYHGLLYHDFRFSPDGQWVAITEPGEQILKLYPAP